MGWRRGSGAFDHARHVLLCHVFSAQLADSDALLFAQKRCFPLLIFRFHRFDVKGSAREAQGVREITKLMAASEKNDLATIAFVVKTIRHE